MGGQRVKVHRDESTEELRDEVERLKRKKAELARKLTAVQTRAQMIKTQRPADMDLALGRCSVAQRQVQDELTELKASIYAASTAAQWSTEQKIEMAQARIAQGRINAGAAPLPPAPLPPPPVAPPALVAPAVFKRVARAASAYIANGARSRRMDLVEALEELDRQFPEWWGKRT
jgi:hypothetical protein